jgi:hypothetical protein
MILPGSIMTNTAPPDSPGRRHWRGLQPHHVDGAVGVRGDEMVGVVGKVELIDSAGKDQILLDGVFSTTVARSLRDRKNAMPFELFNTDGDLRITRGNLPHWVRPKQPSHSVTRNIPVTE